jgi:Uncharacterised nucleotidyltransferase
MRAVLGQLGAKAILQFDVASSNDSVMPSASAEARLLLATATTLREEPRIALARSLAAGADFDLLARLARRHAVTPLVYRFLADTCVDILPEASLAAIRTNYQLIVLLNRHLASELVRLTNLLNDAGVATLSMKGPMLAEIAYGSIEGRQFVDLDLLLHRGDLPRASEVLSAERYTSMLTRRERAGDPYFQEFEDFFSGPGGVGGIDLHWQLTPRAFPFAPDEGSVWRRAITIDLMDAKIGVPDHIDHFIYLCAHGAKHGWHSLSNVCDVAELLRARREIDFGEALDRAVRCGARRIVLTGLCLARTLIDAPLPDDVEALIRANREVIALSSLAARALFRRPPDKEPVVEPWAIPFRSIETSSARARYVVGRLLAPTMGDYQMLPLPRALFSLYWLMRPFRMTLQYGPRLIRGALGGSGLNAGVEPR